MRSRCLRRIATAGPLAPRPRRAPVAIEPGHSVCANPCTRTRRAPPRWTLPRRGRSGRASQRWRVGASRRRNAPRTGRARPYPWRGRRCLRGSSTDRRCALDRTASDPHDARTRVSPVPEDCAGRPQPLDVARPDPAANPRPHPMIRPVQARRLNPRPSVSSRTTAVTTTRKPACRIGPPGREGAGTSTDREAPAREGR